jgi:hypothetical protein
MFSRENFFNIALVCNLICNYPTSLSQSRGDEAVLARDLPDGGRLLAGCSPNTYKAIIL